MKIDETTVIWTWTVLCPSQWHPNLFTEVIKKQTCTLETLNDWIAYTMYYERVYNVRGDKYKKIIQILLSLIDYIYIPV